MTAILSYQVTHHYIVVYRFIVLEFNKGMKGEAMNFYIAFVKKCSGIYPSPRSNPQLGFFQHVGVAEQSQLYLRTRLQSASSLFITLSLFILGLLGSLSITITSNMSRRSRGVPVVVVEFSMVLLSNKRVAVTFCRVRLKLFRTKVRRNLQYPNILEG